jgi:phosphomevalonate kinase
VAACARAVGGAAKPSGAGGGDLAVCFTPLDAHERLHAELARAGFAPLPVGLGAPGLSVAPASKEKR